MLRWLAGRRKGFASARWLTAKVAAGPIPVWPGGLDGLWLDRAAGPPIIASLHFLSHPAIAKAAAGRRAAYRGNEMNVSLNWLREYVRTDLAPEAVAQTLTAVGLNVEEIAEGPGGDAVLDVEVTSNRPDCLGHIGVARELAAATGAELVVPEADYEASEEACEEATRVEVADTDLCPLYMARIVRGVSVGPSPAWLASRLEAVGVRPVNNIVDVTNYVMMECGQPLHAFDFQALQEGRIVVRRAESGERFVAIDHSEHTLSPDRLIIADARRPVALAGVMGGAETEISGATRDVLLEAAVFDPLSIRTTARALNLSSESSYRFERGVDPHGTDWASRRAVGLILETAGGRAARGVCTAGAPLPERAEVTLRFGRIETVLGIAVPAEEAQAILERLGLETLEADAERVRVRVPSWRPDLGREVDLIEEVARHWGYEKVPEATDVTLAYAPASRAERVREAASEVLTAAGYDEAVSFSFTTREKAARLARVREAAGEPLVLRGTPLVLRQSVLPGLLDGLRVNRHAGDAGAKLFEIAMRFVPAKGGELPAESKMLAMASGDAFGSVKGVVETLLARLRLAGRVRFTPAEPHPDYDPERTAAVLLDGEPLGVVGQVSKEAAEAFELDEPPMVAELVFDRLAEEAVLEPRYEPLPQYPAINRDLALVVDESVRWEQVVDAMAAANVPQVESVTPLDVYRGKQVPDGKKSIAVRLVLRDPTRTLTHEDADRMQAKVLAALESVGATLRQT